MFQYIMFGSHRNRFESEPKIEVGTMFGSKYNATYKTLYWKILLFHLLPPDGSMDSPQERGMFDIAWGVQVRLLANNKLE